MAITAAEVKVKFPELVGETDPFIELCIDESELYVIESVWSDTYDMGLYYLTAHLVAINSPNSEGILGKDLTAKAVGSVSLSFGGPPTSNEMLSTTKWGSRYMQIRRMVTAGGFAAV